MLLDYGDHDAAAPTLDEHPWAARTDAFSWERLLADVKQMEAAYLDRNRREYEITKHLSLAQLDPYALLQLKNTGVCTFSLPEALYDLDHPGHYFRRIKSVSLSVPCVAGPYTW